MSQLSSDIIFILLLLIGIGCFYASYIWGKQEGRKEQCAICRVKSPKLYKSCRSRYIDKVNNRYYRYYRDKSNTIQIRHKHKSNTHHKRM